MDKKLKILNQFFGYTSFRGQQEKIIRDVLEGKNVLVIMPTGSGKSLTYQIPALLLPDLTIIISPLIALMKDQVDVLQKKEIDASFINSSLSKNEREKRYKNVSQGKYKLLYVTPERFRKKDFVKILQHRKISLLAVDEAHCISEWGHDFRPDYTRLTEFRNIMQSPPTIALTATATPEVQKDILNQLNLNKQEVTVYHEGIDRPNLFLEKHDVWGEKEKLDYILRIHKSNPGNGIVYFVLIKDLKQMSELLFQKGVRHLKYHGDLQTDQRRNIQEKFMEGENNLVLATNAFGMGIDKENIRFVIHAQVPGSLEAYYQEIGRAGRDGKRSVCSLLYDEQDLNIQLEFMKWNNPTASFYDRLYNMLKSEPEKCNAEGIEFLREQLTYKNRRDYRLETALGILDRYGVIEGEIEQKNLQVVSELPDQLSDQSYLDKKLEREQQKLYKMMMYTKEVTCRKGFIHTYFGIEHSQKCGACDLEIS